MPVQVSSAVAGAHRAGYPAAFLIPGPEPEQQGEGGGGAGQPSSSCPPPPRPPEVRSLSAWASFTAGTGENRFQYLLQEGLCVPTRGGGTPAQTLPGICHLPKAGLPPLLEQVALALLLPFPSCRPGRKSPRLRHIATAAAATVWEGRRGRETSGHSVHVHVCLHQVCGREGS